MKNQDMLSNAKMRLRTILWIAFFGAMVCTAGAAQPSGPFTTIIVVRHAEKDSVGVNPRLTERGKERARSLARVLGNVEVDAAYVSQYLRTQETAQPAADLRHVKPIVFDVDLSRPKYYARLLAEQILQRNKGQTVLVSNHNNIIPFLIVALGAKDPGQIDDRTYDNLFFVVRDSTGTAELFKLKYGSPSD